MSAPAEIGEGAAAGSIHINIQDDRTSPREEAEPSQGMTNSQGWDGKLRVPKNALVANPEALSDPEYSDDDNVLPGEEIAADEGKLTSACSSAHRKKASY